MILSPGKPSLAASFWSGFGRGHCEWPSTSTDSLAVSAGCARRWLDDWSIGWGVVLPSKHSYWKWWFMLTYCKYQTWKFPIAILAYWRIITSIRPLWCTHGDLGLHGLPFQETSKSLQCPVLLLNFSIFWNSPGRFAFAFSKHPRRIFRWGLGFIFFREGKVPILGVGKLGILWTISEIYI
jgi:hypothetical protein